LEHKLRDVDQTIALDCKDSIRIHRNNVEFNNNNNQEGGLFNEGDVLGLGIALFPEYRKCFATCKGNLLGKLNTNI